MLDTAGEQYLKRGPRIAVDSSVKTLRSMKNRMYEIQNGR